MFKISAIYQLASHLFGPELALTFLSRLIKVREIKKGIITYIIIAWKKYPI